MVVGRGRGQAIVNHQPQPHRHHDHGRDREDRPPAENAHPIGDLVLGGVAQEDGAFEVALERFAQVGRGRLARQGAKEVARPRHLGQQLAVRGVARQVLLDFGATLLVELAFEVGT